MLVVLNPQNIYEPRGNYNTNQLVKVLIYAEQQVNTP